MPFDVIRDGGFELGTPNPAWQEGATHTGTPICSLASCRSSGSTVGPRSGNYWAWFGGLSQAQSSFVAQEVRLAADPAILSFWLWIGAASGTVSDTLTVSVDGEQLFSVSEADHETYRSYTEVTRTLSAYADGGTHLLLFRAEISGLGITNISLNDVRLEVPGHTAYIPLLVRETEPP